MDVKVRSKGCYRFGRFALNSAERELLRDICIMPPIIGHGMSAECCSSPVFGIQPTGTRARSSNAIAAKYMALRRR